MTRTTLRRFQAPGLEVPRGTIAVPASLDDFLRGRMHCPAAPLVLGSLRRRGFAAHVIDGCALAEPGHDADGAALFVAGCQQRGGGAAALAAAAPPTDPLMAAAARTAVEEWAATAGTRRLTVAASPWCAGALGALAAAHWAAGQVGTGATVHLYGDLASPPDVLAGTNYSVTRSLEDLRAGDVVVVPAHGMPAKFRALASEHGLRLIDATCPLVARAQREAVQLAERGEHVVVVGREGQPAAESIVDLSRSGAWSVIGSVAAASALRGPDPRRVAYLHQPGTPVEDDSAVVATLRARFPAVREPDPDGLCYAPTDRAETVRAVAAGSEVVLVTGDPNSADARYVATLARERGARSHVIPAPEAIVPDMISGALAIGIAESLTGRSGLSDEVIHALSGLGPLSIARREVRTESPADRADPALAALTSRREMAATPPQAQASVPPATTGGVGVGRLPTAPLPRYT